MNASIAKARALVCACAEQQKENGLVVGTVVEIYKNLVRADECKLSDAANARSGNAFSARQSSAAASLRGCLIVCATKKQRKAFASEQPKFAACPQHG